MQRNKRFDFRIPLNMQFAIRTILIKDRYVNLPKPLVVDIVNMSCSGVLLATHLDLPQEICFYIDFCLKDEKIPAICSVVRKEQSADGNWYYGCKFLHTSGTASSKIRRFVYEQQAKYLAQKANNAATPFPGGTSGGGSHEGGENLRLSAQITPYPGY